MERKEIKFYEDTLLGIKDENGNAWLAIRKTCMDIGLGERQADRQRDNIKTDLVLSKGYANLSILTNGGKQNVACIMERFVTLWLAKISLTPAMQKKNLEAVQKLLRYQLEAADALHKAFYETEEQKSTFHDRIGLEGQIHSLDKKLEMTVAQLNNVEETLDFQNERLNAVMDNMTLTTVQQGRLQRAVKERVRIILGGAHSHEYKEKSHMYFINFWNNIKEKYSCGSRWQDLNPAYFNMAMEYIGEWEFAE